MLLQQKSKITGNNHHTFAFLFAIKEIISVYLRQKIRFS